MPQFTVDIPEEQIPWTYWGSFVGQEAGHNPYTYELISRILLKYKVHSIIEIGAQQGALTMYLGLWGLRLGVPVHTFEIHSALYEPVKHVLDTLKVGCSGDCFSGEALDTIKKVMDGKPTYLICDGGDKPKEFKVFAPMLPMGSLISVHDWGIEITEEDISVHKDIGWKTIDQGEWRKHNVNLATLMRLH